MCEMNATYKNASNDTDISDVNAFYTDHMRWCAQMHNVLMWTVPCSAGISWSAEEKNSKKTFAALYKLSVTKQQKLKNMI